MISFSEERLARVADMERWHFWFAGRQAILNQLWHRHVQGQCKVLDVGCGTGHTLRELSRLGHRVVGIDARPEGLRALRREWPNADVVQAVAPHLPLVDETFDVILMLDVLEHTDDLALLAQSHRLLRPGGWVLLSVPALPWLWSYRDEAAGHLRRYTAADGLALFDRAGLDVLGHTRVWIHETPADAARRALRRERLREAAIDERGDRTHRIRGERRDRERR